METGPLKVITLESDSEDELQILSENIPHYGNFSTPMDIAPELEEKLRISLEKRGNLPGKIKTLKVYATKKTKQGMSSVRASIQTSNGQSTQTINVGSSINAIFSNGVFPKRVKGGGNNNSRKGDTATASKKPNQVRPSPQSSLKRSHRPLPEGVHPRRTEKPSAPLSPVILYSPIRKIKTTPFIPRRKTISQRFDRENVFQEIRSEKIKMNTNFPKVTPDLSLNDLVLNTSDIMFKNECVRVNSNANPVNLSPMSFSSDDEQFVDDSILGIWDSPGPSPRSFVDPFQNLEKEVPILRESNFNCIESTKELDGEEKTLQNMILKNSESEDFVSEVGEKLKGCNIISKHCSMFEGEPNNLENLVNQVEHQQTGEGEKIMDSETEIIIKVVNGDQQCATFESEKQNAIALSKRVLGSSVENGGNDKQSFLNASESPPLWTTVFPPSPPSPPLQSWMNSAALYDLNAGDFLAVTGLCRLETAKEIKRKLNAPKPLIRVLRKRQKK